MNCQQHTSFRPDSLRGRGTSINPQNRFEPVSFLADPEIGDELTPKPKTVFIRDDSATILTKNNSPDIPFNYSVNAYRGCEHGCVYCYARPTHEYLGYSAGLDFETKISVKHDAAELLKKEFQKPGWNPQPVCMSGITDPYQPAERQFGITRKLLEVFESYRNPVSIITKNFLVCRDLDILERMARHRLVRVSVSITSLDPNLTSVLEPRTSRPQRRLEAIRRLSEAGVETSIMTAPLIPGLNDHEIPDLLEAAADAGAGYAGYVMLRLPFAVKDIFEDWLIHHFPDRAGKIKSRIKDMRHGKLNHSEFGERMRGTGKFADQVSRMFKISAARYGLDHPKKPLNSSDFQIPGRSVQLNMFG